MPKKYLELNVLESAYQRIEWAINEYPDFYVSFSGGKDSGVLVNLVIDVAKKLNRLPVKVVFSDLEVIFAETERYTKSIMELPEVEPYWLCFDEIENNASSVYERYFRLWDKTQKDKWVRDMPNMDYVINDNNCPDGLKKYIHSNKIDSWSIECFGEYLCDIKNIDSICNFIGMRTDESYGRHMTIASKKNRDKKNDYTYLTKNEAKRTWTCLPIYDWEISDIWYYYYSTNKDYNRVYDSMMRIGIPQSLMRTCYAFGEEQKKSLWLWSVIEGETWERMVIRVEGANFGKIYNHTNINRNKIKKPDNITWKQYLDILMSQLPPLTKSNFEEKFMIAFRYHKVMYEDKMNLSPDVYIVDSKKESKTKSVELNIPFKCFIEYESLCEAIIKRDFVFKKYGFGNSNKMINRIENMQNNWNDEKN